MQRRFILLVLSVAGMCLAESPTTAPAPPPEVIQANAAVQGFVQALRDADWAKALGYCSARVQEAAKAYPSPEAFFRDVVPIQQLAEQTKDPIYSPADNPAKGGPWAMRALACRVATLERDPADKWSVHGRREVWWQGRIEKTGESRQLMDFPTTPLRDHVAGRLAELRRARAEAIANETELESKLEGVHTRLVPLSGRFEAGGPMLFRLELVNGGPARLVYDGSTAGVHRSFIVETAQGDPAKYTGGPVQTATQHNIIEPGQTVVLLDKWDLARQYGLTEPGRYTVQFRGGVWIAEADPHKTIQIARIGRAPVGKIETRPAAGRRSLRLFPSNVVEIEVARP